MHPNEALIQKLYSCLDSKNHSGMASCYHPDASFKDIGFDLRGKTQIHDMWHMIAETDLRARFRILEADDKVGSANLVDMYTFRSTGNRVTNVIRSDFQFQNGLIISHRDSCDSWKWAMQALGPIKGLAAWLFPGLIRKQAMQLLQEFIDKKK